jgi:hypothetical protein
MLTNRAIMVEGFIHDSITVTIDSEASAHALASLDRMFSRIKWGRYSEILKCSGTYCYQAEPMRPAVVSTIEEPHGPEYDKHQPMRRLPKGWGYTQGPTVAHVYCPDCFMAVQGLTPPQPPEARARMVAPGIYAGLLNLRGP